MRIIKLPTGIFEFDPQKPIGKRGGFGQVFLGKNQNGEEVAVKKLHLSALDAGHRELRVADELRGKPFQYVIPFIDAGIDADTGNYFTVMPKADESLQDRINLDKYFSSHEIIFILLQIIQGLLEVGDLVHRDLKPDNILFHNKKWKIADFGIAMFVEDSTSTNTLKDCLSPLYAAPEQWRFERSTHATDIYAVGCIAFCLLNGSPPFTRDPQSEHQNATVPHFTCSESRLSTLINMCLRKVACSRPSLDRVYNLLLEIEKNNCQIVNNSALNELAQTASYISFKEQENQAKAEAEKLFRAERTSLERSSNEILRNNAKRFWEKIYSQAPNIIHEKKYLAYILNLKLGQAEFKLYDTSSVDHNDFIHSGWDVITYSQIAIEQHIPSYTWSASLWYAKLKNQSEYRWYEASYFSLFSNNSFEPHFEYPGKNADIAASNITGKVQFAFGPIAIDDEKEDEFHERWIWLLAKAAGGQLRHPARLPFEWPPL